MRFKKNKAFFMLLVVMIIIVTKSMIYGANDLSRFATIKNLVENNGFALTQEKEITADTIMAGGSYYSSKPPLLSIFGAGVYWALYHVFDLRLTLDLVKENLVVYFINLIIVGGSLLLLVIFFYKSLKFYDLAENAKIFLCGVLVFGTLIFSYLGTLNNHLPSAAFIYAGFYYLLCQIKKGFNYPQLLAAGFLLSIAFSVEPIFSGIFILFVLIYYSTDREKSKYIKPFIIGLLPLIIYYALINIYLIGSPLPPYFNKSLYEYPGSYWSQPIGIDALHEPKIVYAFNLLIGSHGLLLYTPIFFYAFWGLKKIIFNSRHQDIRIITVLISLAIFFYTLFLIFFTENYGGTSYGARWFVCLTPLLLFYLAIFYREIITKHFNLFTMLLVFSVFFAYLGYLDPWFHNSLRITNTYYFPLLTKLMYFKEVLANLF